MYEIVAVIRLNRLQQTKEALLAAGFPSFTASRALGRGKGAEPPPGKPGEAGASVLPRLFPKKIISLVVPEALLTRAVQAIIQANRTGAPGDGKIFVIPVTGAWRIRSGESGNRAIDEMTG